ncbi:hypothetical protein ACFSC4_15600 [Deinococcus malanensis]
MGLWEGLQAGEAGVHDLQGGPAVLQGPVGGLVHVTGDPRV